MGQLATCIVGVGQNRDGLQWGAYGNGQMVHMHAQPGACKHGCEPPVLPILTPRNPRPRPPVSTTVVQEIAVGADRFGIPEVLFNPGEWLCGLYEAEQVCGRVGGVWGGGGAGGGRPGPPAPGGAYAHVRRLRAALPLYPVAGCASASWPTLLPCSALPPAGLLPRYPPAVEALKARQATPEGLQGIPHLTNDCISK